MGLFSSKKIITVSSTLYNMAGDERDRPDFLKSTVFSSTISNSPSFSDTLNSSYMKGPGIQQRNFFKYYEKNNLPGLTSATIDTTFTLDPSTIESEIPVSDSPSAPANLIVKSFTAEVSDGSFEYWIERWILENYPERINEDWIGDFNPNTNVFSVEFPDNTTFLWLNTDYISSARYIIAKYIEYVDQSEGPIQTSSETVNDPVLPDTTGFTQISTSGSFIPVTLNRVRNTILSYNNGDPDVQIETDVDVSIAGELDNWNQEWKRETLTSVNNIQVQGLSELWLIQATDAITNDYVNVTVTETDLGNGVIETRTETVTGDQIIDQYTHQFSTKSLFIGEQYGSEKIFIYKIGSGNQVLDSLVQDVVFNLPQEFFPFMPIRINNVSVLDSAYEDLFNDMSKAYKRGFGYTKSFSSLVESVEDNPSINDIDYAYLCFGASLNVKEMACRRYIFNFFEKLIPFQSAGSSSAMSDLQDKIDQYNIDLENLNNWQTEVGNLNYGTDWNDVSVRVDIPYITPPTVNTIKLSDTSLGFDYRLLWVHAEINQFNGVFTREDSDAIGKAAKKNEIELRVGTSFTWQQREYFNTRDGGEERIVEKTIPSMEIWWQKDSGYYQVLTIWGLVSYNYIYGSNAVIINSTEALQDNEESGFLVPLHYPTMIEMGIVDYTQMSTANSHILFNSYEITKQRWYERGLFRIFLVIAIIIIGVTLFPGAFASGSGILGGNLIVGSALGLTGTAALIAGTVANYLASIIVSEVLKVFGATVFGEKWSNLFAAIASFSINIATVGIKLFSVKGILGLSNVVANGYQGYVQGSILEMQEDLVTEQDAYEEMMDKINEMLGDLYNQNGLKFNPMSLMDGLRNTSVNDSYIPETLDGYISRTTMTGGDVVELTLAMVNDFVEIQQTLPRNIS